MKIVLFRHAEKQHDGTSNPPLSQVGLAQAEKLKQALIELRLPKPLKIFTSQKRRTQQTFSPMAEHFQIKIEASDLFDERKPVESHNEFCSRIKQTLEKLNSEPSEACLYICSHMDWVEEFIRCLPAEKDLLDFDLISWKSAQYAIFEKDNEFWKVAVKGHIKP